MDDKIQEMIHQGVHGFMQEVALGMNNMPKEFEEDKKYLFAFLDHLGFSNKVLKATENYGWLSFCADMGILIDDNLRHLLNACQQWSSSVSMVREKRFSDSVCLYWEIGDYEDETERCSTSELAELIKDVFFLIANIQMNASIHDALFRGGIAVGHYFEYNNITVSDALVRAHNVENSIKIPVVGIDETVWQELHDEGLHQWFASEGYLAKYSGKKRDFEYIDFINTILKNERITESGFEGMYFTNMRKAILSNWSDVKASMTDRNMSAGLKEKYVWLFEYYNRKCEEKNMIKYAIEKECYDELKAIGTY